MFVVMRREAVTISVSSTLTLVIYLVFTTTALRNPKNDAMQESKSMPTTGRALVPAALHGMEMDYRGGRAHCSRTIKIKELSMSFSGNSTLRAAKTFC